MAKFSDAKVEDRVWDIRYGWGVVTDTNDLSGGDYVLIVEFENEIYGSYTLDGFDRKTHKYPMLYWNEVRLPSAEEDKKPFKLVEYLKENIKPKKFNGTDKNWCFYYDTILKHFESGAHSNFQTVGTVYFTEEDIKKVIPKLEEEKITSEQLTHAFKELGWL